MSFFKRDVSPCGNPEAGLIANSKHTLASGRSTLPASSTPVASFRHRTVESRLRAAWAGINRFALMLVLAGLSTLAVASSAQAAMVPTNVVAQAASSTGVTVTWDKSQDPGFRYFAVRRSTNLTLDQSLWTRLSGNDVTPTVTDTGLVAGTTYYYYVTEIDSGGAVSARSNVASATTPTGPPPVLGNSCAAAGTTWCGDFDVANSSQYSQELGQPASEITFPTSPSVGGTHSMRVRLSPSDIWTDNTNRMQVRESGAKSSSNASGFGEGADSYFHVDLYIDPSTTIACATTCAGTPGSAWRTLFTWPDTTNGNCSEGGFGLSVLNSSNNPSPTGIPAIFMGGDGGVCGANNSNYWRMNNPVQGAWYSFVVHRKFSYDPAVGFFEFWLRKPGETTYTKQTFFDGSQRMSQRTLGVAGSSDNMRVGDYRNHLFTTTDVLYYDNIRAATTFASAQ